MTAAEKDEPTAGRYAALLAILEKIGQGPSPIPLRGCIRATYKAGLPGEVVEVRAEAGRLAAAWTARRS